MTEIAVFPPDMAEPEPEDNEGMWRGIYRYLRKISRNTLDPKIVRRDLAQHIWSITIDPIPIQIAAGAGFLDLPQQLGPGVGEMWDVSLIAAQGFTAGSVLGYKNMPAIASGAAQGALRAPFPAAGVLTFGKSQLPLRHGERLSFVATGITGAVLISGEAVRVAEEYWAEYLL